ncbi:MAG: hypothetical protein IJ549_01655 [Prevotella sp.]|nr:hypothetical protein [Prevotella sp.]
MRKNLLLFAAIVLSSAAMAQNVTLKGVLHDNRYKVNGELQQMEYLWTGSVYDENGNYLFFGNLSERGIYAMTWDGTTLGKPTRDPAIEKSDIIQGTSVNLEKARWATTQDLMCGNSGAAYVDGFIYTFMSRDEQSTTDDVLFNVRRWDAETGDLLDNLTMPKSANLENCGIYVNPKDKKAYGLFYLTEQALPEEITSDPEFFTDEEGDASSTDAGYCLCEIDLTTLKLTPITPGLYYYNFITFAINKDGRAFALTSGGANGTINDEGKMIDINGNLTGATLCEFDLATGKIIKETSTGYCSKYKRQAACFSKSDANTMYWVGYLNDGKGINEWSSWGELPDREWETNGKYDTALYTINVETGEATRKALVDKRSIFSVLWVDGDAMNEEGIIDDDDNIKPEPQDDTNSINSVKTSQAAGQYYNLNGQRVGVDYKGIVVKNGKKILR